MCGIMGYVGSRAAGPILIDGLRRLEYRGYDSAGIAVLEDERRPLHPQACRQAGAPSPPPSPTAGPTATQGIGHTRWATHGRPSDVNAHPHPTARGDVVVIHNGIVENYLALKAELAGQRPHVPLRDGHGGHPPPASSSYLKRGWRPGGGAAQDHRAAGRRPRHRGDEPRGAGDAGGGAGGQRRRRRRRLRRRRELPGQRPARPPAPHAPRRLPGGRRGRADHRRRRLVLDREGAADGEGSRRRSPTTRSPPPRGNYKHFMLKEIMRAAGVHPGHDPRPRPVRSAGRRAGGRGR